MTVKGGDTDTTLCFFLEPVPTIQQLAGGAQNLQDLNNAMFGVGRLFWR